MKKYISSKMCRVPMYVFISRSLLFFILTFFVPGELYTLFSGTKTLVKNLDKNLDKNLFKNLVPNLKDTSEGTISDVLFNFLHPVSTPIEKHGCHWAGCRIA